MKNKFQWIWGASVLVLIVVAFVNGVSGTKNTVRETYENDGVLRVEYDFAGREDVITKVWTHDTLTTTENDTLTLGYTLASPYQYSYQLKVAKISGTPSLKVVLDNRNSLSNSDWVGVDSISISGADSTRTYFLINGANTWGLQHRLRLVGTTGVNQYDITGLLKKTVQ